MAYNVFGNPITNSTLEGMPEYAGKTITRFDRAYVAMNMKNAQDKDVNALQYVENLKKEYGNGVSTLCVVYNATGDTITYATAHDWHGHIGKAPYPAEIANGQWGAFLHVHTAGAAVGSTAAVVYQGKNAADTGCAWLLSWENPWNRVYNNKVYTEIRSPSHYESNSVWSSVYDLLDDSELYSKNTWEGCVSTISIGSDTSPTLEGILTLEGV